VIADPFAYTVFESDLEYGMDFDENSSDPTISNMTGMGPWNASNGPTSENDFDIVTQNIFGTDDRKLVGDTTAFPWRTVSYYSFKHPDISGTGRCTAFAVNKYIALTNSHCLYMNGKYVTRGSNTYIAPGQKGSSQPFGRFPVCAGRASVPWMSRSECHSRKNVPEYCVGYDYAAIRVSRPMSSIKTFMPLVFNYNPGRGTTLNTAGYPSVAQGRKTTSQYRTSGQVYQAPGTDRVLRHKLDISGGQSGSPIWRYRPNEAKSRQTTAINAWSGGNGVYNGGSRFVSANFDAIKSMLESISC
jgi:V8-like Glu-specific endopeptidase